MAREKQQQTRAEDQITEPATTAPGDAPADTTDPDEIVSSRVPQPSPEASKVGTVNAAVKIGDRRDAAASSGDERVEKYQATRPDGTEVTVEHNIDTGDSKVV